MLAAGLCLRAAGSAAEQPKDSAKQAWQQKLRLGQVRAVAGDGDEWLAPGSLRPWEVVVKAPAKAVLGEPACRAQERRVQYGAK